MTLLQQFVDAELIHGLTTGDKVLASLYITLMGMSITFVALTVLWGCISLISVVFKPKTKKEKIPARVEKEEPGRITPTTAKNKMADKEIIAVVTAAVALALNTSVSNFKVRAILRTDDPTPQWGKVGRIEQLTRTIQK